MHGFWSRLPALATIDEIGFKCLIWGFPFMTLGLISGSILAEAGLEQGISPIPRSCSPA